MKTFCKQTNLHQATMTPITVIPGAVAAYTVSHWNNTQACRPKKANKNSSLTDGASRSNFNANYYIKQRRRGKHDLATPDESNEKTSACHRQKEPHHAVKVDTAAKKKAELGMFYLKNMSINPLDVFPKDMPHKICTNFTCTGKECNNATCDFIHPKRPSELKGETILAIASHFTKKDNGWFNMYHFTKKPNITDKVKKLLRNS
jgi:hypothetical protein